MPHNSLILVLPKLLTLNFIYIIGIVQAFFIEFLLLNKKNKNLSDKILSVWMFVLGFHLFLSFLFSTEYYYTYPFFLGFMQPFPLLHGPLLLLYVYSLIRPKPKVGWMELLHFLPAFLFYIFLFPDAFLQTGEELLEFAFSTLETNPPTYWMIFSPLNEVSGAIYAIWCLIVLNQHKKAIKDNFSYIEKINLSWLMKLIIGIGVIWIVVIVTEESDYIYVAVTIFVFVIGYFGSRQVAIFTDNTPPGEHKDSDKGKYVKSSLTSKKSQEYLDTLKQFMEEEKPYLEAKISLKDVSERLEIHPNHLSQVINEMLNVNFYDFINGYRVEEFKNRLANDTDKRFTLLAHAYDSGYSSKSSFNEVFKKFTGLTPSQYQKQLNSGQ